MKRQWYFLHILFLCFLLLSGCTNTNTNTNIDSYITNIPSPTPTFEQFATNLFIEEISADTISLHYSLSTPENYGISNYPITLGSVTDAVSFDENALTLYEQLSNYDISTLSKENALTFQVLERHLNLMMQTDFSSYLSELLGPTTGYQAQLPILLAEYRFDSKQDVEQYLTLLPCVYDYFKEIAEFQKEKSEAGYFMNDTTAKEIISQCEEFCQNPDDNFLVSTFKERLDTLSLTAIEQADFLSRNQTALYTYVFPAYDLLIDTLTECLGTGTNEYGLSHFEDGKEYYALLTAYNTGSDRSMEELKQLLLDTIISSCNEMATALTADQTVYSNALKPNFPETDPEEIIHYIEKSSSQDFPFVDCGNYSIKYIPQSLEEYVSPAMYLVPPIDNYTAGVIYINQNPLYDLDTIFPTVAHEGYPGHLYQTVATLSSDIHPLRYLLSPSGYEEGWATYVETYSYQYANFSDNLTSFLQADQIATLCLYALSDIFIHYDSYTPEQLSTFLSDYGFPEQASAVIYETLLSEPGAYLPYAVGYLEFMELQKEAKQLWGEEYSDYKFHEFLLETGPLPFSILQEVMNNYNNY